MILIILGIGLCVIGLLAEIDGLRRLSKATETNYRASDTFNRAAEMFDRAAQMHRRTAEKWTDR